MYPAELYGCRHRPLLVTTYARFVCHPPRNWQLYRFLFLLLRSFDVSFHSIFGPKCTKPYTAYIHVIDIILQTTGACEHCVSILCIHTHTHIHSHWHARIVNFLCVSHIFFSLFSMIPCACVCACTCMRVRLGMFWFCQLLRVAIQGDENYYTRYHANHSTERWAMWRMYIRTLASRLAVAWNRCAAEKFTKWNEPAK